MITAFADLADEHGLTVLTKEQVRDVCQMISAHGANARAIAYGGGMLLTQGANFDYWAGLEYDRDGVMVRLAERGTPEVVLYEATGDEDESQIAQVIAYCKEAASKEVPASK